VSCYSSFGAVSNPRELASAERCVWSKCELTLLFVLFAFSPWLPCDAADRSSATQNSQQFSMAPGVDGQFVGMFSEDAKFRRPSWLERLRDKHVTGPFRTAEPQALPSGLIRSYVRRVQDYRPPSHATVSLQPHSLAGNLVSDFATVAYGHRRILIAPQRVTTDSRQRVIVTDSAVPAVHVLDPRGENSFSILAGSGRRIAWPSGVAVDADDNIYVADPDKGSVFVYDTYGRFVRTLGDFHGETLFEAPIANRDRSCERAPVRRRWAAQCCLYARPSGQRTKTLRRGLAAIRNSWPEDQASGGIRRTSLSLRYCDR